MDSTDKFLVSFASARRRPAYLVASYGDEEEGSGTHEQFITRMR
jgi:hypothetical protein